MEQNNKRSAEDAERPAVELGWKSPSQFGSPELQAIILANLAAPAVDAAKLDDLGKLKALAEAATPGPWGASDAYADNGQFSGVDIHAADGTVLLSEDSGPGAADAAYIAAVNPAAILRIAALVAQQAARIAELEAELAGEDPVATVSRNREGGTDSLTFTPLRDFHVVDGMNLYIKEGK